MRQLRRFIFCTEQNLIEDKQEVKFDTRSGILKCRVENGKYFMQIPILEIKDYHENRGKLISALGLNEEDLDNNYSFALASNGYLYVKVKSINVLQTIKPDYKSLLNITLETKDFTAVTVFSTETVEQKSNAHLRFFAPYYGIDEDPVTGSANGPLLLVFNHLGLINLDNEVELNFEQGDFINRNGRIGVKYLKTSE